MEDVKMPVSPGPCLPRMAPRMATRPSRKRPQWTEASQQPTATSQDDRHASTKKKMRKQEQDIEAPKHAQRIQSSQPRTGAYPDDQHSNSRSKARKQERDIEASEHAKRTHRSQQPTAVDPDEQYVKARTKARKQEGEVGAPELPQRTNRSQPPTAAYPAEDQSASARERARQQERYREIESLEAQLAAEPPSCCRHWFFWIFSVFGWVVWALTLVAIKGDDWIRKTDDSIEEFRVEDDGDDGGFHASCEGDLPSKQWCTAFNAFTISQTVAIVAVSFAMLLLFVALCRPTARGVGWGGGSFFLIYSGLQATVVGIVAGIRSTLQNSTSAEFLVFTSGRDITFGNTYAIASLAAFLGGVVGIALLALASKAGPGLVYDCMYNRDSDGACCWGSDAVDGGTRVVESSEPSRRQPSISSHDSGTRVVDSSESSRRQPSISARGGGPRVVNSSEASRRRPSISANARGGYY